MMFFIPISWWRTKEPARRRAAAGATRRRSTCPECRQPRAALQVQHHGARAICRRRRRRRFLGHAMRYDDGLRAPTGSPCNCKPFEGVIPNTERRGRDRQRLGPRGELSRYRQLSRAAEARGARRRQAQHRRGDRLSIAQAGDWFRGCPQRLMPKTARSPSASSRRSTSGSDRGSTYSTLNRASGTLFGGESQRILADRLRPHRRARRAGRALIRAAPARQRTAARNAQRLRDLGNTVIVVEHDEEAIRTADYLVDMGLGAAGSAAAWWRARGGAEPRKHHRADDRCRCGGRTRRATASRSWARARQSPQRHRRAADRAFHLRHRRLGRRQIDPDHRDALQRARPAAQRRPPPSGRA